MNKTSSKSGSLAARGSGYPEPVERLVAAFAKLPGVGRRSAERLAFWVLTAAPDEALELARAVEAVKKDVRHCSVCFNLTDADPCAICSDTRRERGVVLVIEQPRDLIALEQTGLHRGVYHVLLGRLSPLEGIGPEELTVGRLLGRVEDPSKNSGGEPVREVVLGLNPTLEGDGTALFLSEELSRRGVSVTRLARGLPAGGTLEQASKAVLADALAGRQPVR